MRLFKDKIATLLAEHEEFLARKNNPMKGGNGIITRYEHPVPISFDKFLSNQILFHMF